MLSLIEEEKSNDCDEDYLLLDIYSFEQGVKEGKFSDRDGVASLVLNGRLFTTYNVYIDRCRITRAGAIITFASLLREYEPDEILIKYEKKKHGMPRVLTYRKIKSNTIRPSIRLNTVY